jgi:hypothetical protein
MKKFPLLTILLIVSLFSVLPVSISADVTVDPSWSNVQIQGAIDDAIANGGTITFNPGVYTNVNLEIDINIGDKSFSLMGAGQGVTILDGGASYRIMHLVNVDTYSCTVSIEGFTFQNGKSTVGGAMFNEASSPQITDCTFKTNVATSSGGGSGGAMCNSQCSSPVLTRCTFFDNTAGQSGGAMRNDEDSYPVITQCEFMDNHAGLYGGALYNYHSASPVITQCKFKDNIAGHYGGAIYNWNQCSPVVTQCEFSENSAGHYGGAIYNFEECSPVVTQCEFSENSAGYFGGGMYNYDACNPVVGRCSFIGNVVTGVSPSAHDADSGSSLAYGAGMYNYDACSPIVTNCIFVGNIATEGPTIYAYGGGMYNYDACFPIVTNCTFYANSALAGGAVYNHNATPKITNCILWGNSKDACKEIDNDTCTPIVTYSNVQGGHTGIGNINANPLFFNAPADVSLLVGSPCIDTGTTTSGCEYGAVSSTIFFRIPGHRMRDTIWVHMKEAGNGSQWCHGPRSSLNPSHVRSLILCLPCGTISRGGFPASPRMRWPRS